jgi:hypothetical protein
MSIVKEDLNIIKNCIKTIKESIYIREIFVICLGIVNYVNNSNIIGFTLESFNTVTTYLLLVSKLRYG